MYKKIKIVHISFWEIVSICLLKLRLFVVVGVFLDHLYIIKFVKVKLIIVKTNGNTVRINTIYMHLLFIVNKIVVIYLAVKQEEQCGGTLSVKFLETALQQCEVWLISKEHGDIDLKKAVSV